jgi:RHS repeat-associated protein
MLEEMGIVHMNGRLYDPRLARVMSADPIVQAPAMSQSYNRYSYVMNGPLSLTDPSGFSWWTDFRDNWLKPIVAIVITIYAPEIAGELWGPAYGTAAGAAEAGVALSSSAAIVQGATAGAMAGAVTGGTVESAFYGGVSGAMFGSLHGMDDFGGVIAHGVAGGTMSAAQGGDFGSGFASGAFSKAASLGGLFGNPGEGTAMRARNAIMAGIVGGTASVLGGGKFANGAVTGAMSRLLNDSATVNGRRYIKAFPGGPGGPEITFNNDNPNGPSTYRMVTNAAAEMIEQAVLSSGVNSVNINSTTEGDHAPTSRHYSGQAIDINQINGARVDSIYNQDNVRNLQEAFSQQSNIRENFGPFSNSKVVDGTLQYMPSVASAHRAHTHFSGQQ